MKAIEILSIAILSIVISGCQNKEILKLEDDIRESDKTIESIMLQNAQLIKSEIELNKIIEEYREIDEELTSENSKLAEVNSELKERIESLNISLTESTQIKHPIQIEFENEMETWSGNTAEGVNIIINYANRWNDEMEKYYDLLYLELDEDKKKWLESSQGKWEAYVIENEELGWQILDQQYHGGSIIKILAADLYYSRYHDRAIDLIQKYEEITLDY